MSEENPIDNPIKIRKGKTFEMWLTFTLGEGEDEEPIDISDWSFRGQVRKNEADEEALLDFQFEVQGDDDNILYAFIPASDSEAIEMPTPCGHRRSKIKALYDIEGVKPASPEDIVYGLSEGTATITGEATHE